MRKSLQDSTIAMHDILVSWISLSMHHLICTIEEKKLNFLFKRQTFYQKCLNVLVLNILNKVECCSNILPTFYQHSNILPTLYQNYIYFNRIPCNY